MDDFVTDFLAAKLECAYSTPVVTNTLGTVARVALQGAGRLASVIGSNAIPLAGGTVSLVKQLGWKDCLIAGVTTYYAVSWARSKDLTISRPRWRTIKNLMGARPEMVVDTATTFTRRSQLESVREGSEFVRQSIPKSQVSIGTMRDGLFVVHGCAVRLEDYLVMPDHVYSQCERVWARGVGDVEISRREPLLLATDLVAVQLEPREMSILGAQRAVIQHVLPQNGKMVTATGPLSKGSTGVLADDSVSFGYVNYHGSTEGGFSGAGYYDGKKCAGIHQRGGPVNQGWSMSFIYATLCHEAKLKPEDSEDWLRGEFMNGRKIRIDRSWGDLDSQRVQVAGRYAIVDKSSLDRAFGADWRGSNEEDFVPVSRRDYESISGECNPATLRGVSPTQGSTTDSEKDDRLALINALSNVSNTKLKNFLKSLNSADAPAKGTPGQVAKPKPSTA